MRFPWNRAEAEMEQEIAYHLHQLTAEYKRQGYSDEEARLRARREFGGREQVKEQCRQERRWAWLTGLQQDVIFGLRIMRKAPVVTLAAALSLALGIGANTAIVSLMNVVLWQDLPVPSPKQLMLVKWQSSRQFPREVVDGGAGSFGTEDGVENVGDFFSYRSYRTLRQNVSKRAMLAAFVGFSNAVSISYAGQPTVAKERGVSGNFFSTLEVKPELGQFFSDRDDAYDAPSAVVVSYRFWVRALGADPAAIGRSIRINNRPYVIRGVLQRNFYGLVPGDATEIYTPLHHAAFLLEVPDRERPLDNDRFWCVSILARLAPGESAAQLRPALEVPFSHHLVQAAEGSLPSAAHPFIRRRARLGLFAT